MAVRPQPRTGHPKLDQAYRLALQSGGEQQFLDAHPRYAAMVDKRPRRGGLAGLPADVKEPMQTERKLEDFETQQQINYQNPDYVTALGSGRVTYDENGRPVYSETLSPEQQAILQSGQGLTQQGQRLASQGLSNYSAFAPGDYGAERARVEEAAFQALTRDLDENYTRDLENMEQTLSNRGIPLDPTNPRYQQEREALDKRYDRARLEARQSAVNVGGQELGAEYQRNLTTHQQGLSDISALQQQGTGLLMPNLPGYQAPQYELPGAIETRALLEQIKQSGKLTDAQIRQIDAAISQMGAGGGAEETPPPFQD